MKFLILIVAVIATVSSEDLKPQMQWLAKYGEYGVKGILPIQYKVPSYNLPLQYPFDISRFPFPAQYTMPAAYPIPVEYTAPKISKVAVDGPGHVVTSFDPDYFASNYGFYPSNK